MPLSEDNGSGKPFDVFELATAILLGLAAVGASLASLQAGQWGGRQLDAFSESNTLATKAATQYNEDTVMMNADYAAIAVAKQHILEARDASDRKARERHLEIASYFYTTQLSHAAYKALELPGDLYVEDEDEAATPGKPAAAGPAAAPAAGAAPAAAPKPTPAADAADDEEEDAPAKGGPPTLEREIPDEDLFESLPVELDEDYEDEMLSAGTRMFEEADKKFGEGRIANENGDMFDLVGVLFTVALFFGGLGLVFKTPVRWGFFALGALVFLASAVRMAMLPWAA